MKAIVGGPLGLAASLCVVSLITSAQSPPPALAAPEPQIVSAGPHERTGAYTTWEADASGAVQEVVHRYTEVATGLNFLDPDSGQWRETREAFELVPGAAVARQGPHQLLLLANLADAGAIDALTPASDTQPEDRRFLSNPRWLAFYDAAAQKSVLLAEVKDAIGQLVAPNVVLYDDCFDTLAGAIRVTYAKWGWEVDVLLYEAPGDPAADGLNPETTLLEIYTEFLAAPEPQKFVRQAASGLTDETLNFGDFQIDRGKAFALLEGGLSDEIGVAKTWTQVANRQFLVESAPYLEMKPLLDKLPARQEAKAPPSGASRGARAQARLFNGRHALLAALSRSTPEAVAASQEARHSAFAATATRPPDATTAHSAFRTPHSLPAPLAARPSSLAAAAAPPPRPAVVLDYVTLNTSQSNYLFQGDTTYYVTGLVVLSGTTTLEGGTVIKFANSGARSLQVTGSLNCLTTPYRPAVFTAKDDDSVGEIISGSTGAPSGYYGAPALELRTANQPLRHVRFAFADTALFYHDFSAGANNVLAHAQFVRCNIALRANGYGGTVQSFKLRNALIDTTPTAVYGYNFQGGVEHLTLHACSTLGSSYAGTSSLSLTNSLLVALGSYGNVTVNQSSCASAASSNLVFHTVGAGGFYLKDDTHRNQGTANIDPTLAKDLKQLTTYAPLVRTLDFTTDTLLSRAVPRDEDPWPDRGYHYVPLDWCWTTLNLTNATLTLTNGVAVGIYGTKGTTLRTGAKFLSEGSPTALNRLVRYHAVQEQALAWGGTATTMSLLDVNTSTPPEARLRFTDVSLLANTAGRRYLLYNAGSRINPLAISDSQLRGAYLNLYSTTGTGMTVALTNNLVERGYLYFYQVSYPGYYGFTLDGYNNLFRGGTLVFNNQIDSPAWTVKDNLFDCDSLSGGTAPFTVGNNGYRSGLTSLGGAGNKTGLAPDYQAGPATNWFGVVGAYYYPASGGATSLANLLNAGSRSAAAAGLYHFTTTTNQVKEAGTTVDIGYHYVADPRVRFVATDTTAKGDWKSLYGLDGYHVILDSTSYPAYASITPTGKSDWTWASSTSDPRALLRAGTGRIAACWNSSTYFELALTQTDTLPHRLALYCLDWDTTQRAQTIEIKDPQTGVVLDSRSVSAFNGGQYWVWDIAGNATIRLTRTAGANAVLSGLFFGPSPAALLDSDGDGLADYLEDRNGNGSLDTGETKPDDLDTDYDGRSDGQEYADGTDPLSASDVTPARLGYWRFNGANPWQGERGQLPIQSASIQAVSSFDGNGLNITDSTAILKYRDVEADGRPNLNLRNGGFRFWFKPTWSSTNQGGTGPGQWASFVHLGPPVDAQTNVGYFRVAMQPDGNLVWIGITDPGPPPAAWRYGYNISLLANQWYEFVVKYTPTNTQVFVNGNSVGGTQTNNPSMFPPANIRARGFTLGGNTNAQEQVKGVIDEFEAVNYRLDEADLRSAFPQLSAAVTNSPPTITLQWARDPNYQVKIDKKTAESSTWTNIVSGTSAWRYVDTNVVVGQRYDYNVYPLGADDNQGFLRAAIAAPPVEHRGKVLLMVDQKWTTNATFNSNISLLITNLVGDGWTVVSTNMPRHIDDYAHPTNYWPNAWNITNVIKPWILNNYDPSVTNVVFIVGHVAIPYSGSAASDGHTSPGDDHRGAWVADAYYGSTNNAFWTDTTVDFINVTVPEDSNIPGDGRFDQDYLPSALQLAVGRVDFARLPVFTNSPAFKTELDLLNQYLLKDHLYRTKRLVFAERAVYAGVFSTVGNVAVNSDASRNGSRLFGLEPGKLAFGDFFWETSHSFLWGHLSGNGSPVGINGVGATHYSGDLVDPANEPQGAFYRLYGSWFGDWNLQDNLLRALTATGSSGLAAFGGPYTTLRLRLELQALGEPLATGLLRSIALLAPFCPRWVSLIGDPTLRLQVLAPPSGLTGNSGTTVALSWNPSPEAGAQYCVYRSTNGLNGPWTKLTPTPLPGTSYTDSPAPSGAKVYQVRALKLQVTGSGSYTNLSQGVFLNVN